MDARIIVGVIVLVVLAGCSNEVAPETFPSLDFEDVTEREPVVSAASSQERLAAISSLIIHAEKEDVPIEIEVADSPDERERGLMGRGSLLAGKGMLFVFEQEEPVAFHMKDVPFLVDILFIGSDFTVRNMATMTPCRSTPCPVWQSREPVKYALELPGGFIKQHRMGRETTVTLR